MSNIPNGNLLQALNSPKERSMGGTPDVLVIRELYTAKKMRLCYRRLVCVMEHCCAHQPTRAGSRPRTGWAIASWRPFLMAGTVGVVLIGLVSLWLAVAYLTADVANQQQQAALKADGERAEVKRVAEAKAAAGAEAKRRADEAEQQRLAARPSPSPAKAPATRPAPSGCCRRSASGRSSRKTFSKNATIAPR
jgi:hypothetical protein